MLADSRRRSGHALRSMRGDNAAAASSIAFLIAGIVFVAAITLLLYTADRKVPPANPEDLAARYNAQAETILTILGKTSGYANDTAGPWPDAAWDPAAKKWNEAAASPANGELRPGLVRYDGDGLEWARLAALNASAPDANDGVLSYNETLEHLGLGGANPEVTLWIRVCDAANATSRLRFGPAGDRPGPCQGELLTSNPPSSSTANQVARGDPAVLRTYLNSGTSKWPVRVEVFIFVR